jgi:aryl-alcohol dehydrogenase-like predicted oxidoreductase
MEHVRLGRTGLKVSRICLGTMTFGVQCDEAQSHAILDRAAEAGVTFIDTADGYPLGGGPGVRGRTEEIIGRWLQGRRDDFIVATKGFSVMGTREFHRGGSRKHVLDAVEGSLRRLGVDYIDLYQMHHYDPETPLDETLGALDDLVRSGKVRYVGCSNYLAYQLARALGRSDVRGFERLASVQPRYNLLFREIERELLPLCAEEGVGVISYNPLAGGMLTGRHDRTQEPPVGGRFALESPAGQSASAMYRDRYWHDRSFDAIERIEEVAAEAGVAMPTLAVAWVLANPVVTSAIVGASSAGQLDASLAGAETTLAPGTLARLEELTHEFRFGDAAR